MLLVVLAGLESDLRGIVVKRKEAGMMTKNHESNVWLDALTHKRKNWTDRIPS